MKRVYTLYRVSTKQQVDQAKNDIPMQRIECREFAQKQGWEIVRELEEKAYRASRCLPLTAMQYRI